MMNNDEVKWDDKIKPNQVQVSNKFGETEWQDLPEQGNPNHYLGGKPGTVGELTQKIKAKLEQKNSLLGFKYSYKQLAIPHAHDVITELNKYGAEGWRCVQIIPDLPFTKVILEKKY